MDYITLEDVSIYMNESNLNYIIEGKEDIIRKILKSKQDVISLYIGHKCDLDTEFNYNRMDDRNMIIVENIIKLTLFELVKRFSPDRISQVLINDYAEVMKNLEFMNRRPIINIYIKNSPLEKKTTYDSYDDNNYRII